jgi:hypothetical protein
VSGSAKEFDSENLYRFEALGEDVLHIGAQLKGIRAVYTRTEIFNGSYKADLSGSIC